MAVTINASTSSGLINTADTSGILQLQTANTAALTIDASQNVGIGTASPAVKLSVDSGSSGLMSNFNSTNANGGYLRFQSSGTSIADIGTAAQLVSGSASDFGINVRPSGSLIFGTSNTERMRLDASGNLLVGTTTSSPGYGNTSTGSRISATQANFSVNTTDWAMTVNQNGSDGGTRYFIGFRVSNSSVGNITSNGTTTAYNTSSDYRLKNTIAPMTGALAKVAQLKPCTYRWNADGSDGEGFIAHELAEVCPDAVTGAKDGTRIEQYEISPAVQATYDEDGNELTAAVDAVMGEREVPDYQGIDVSFLVATLTAAIQEQQALITQLQADVAALKGA